MAENKAKDLLNKIVDNLDIVFATTKTKAHFVKDADFQRLIGKQVIILSAIGGSKEAAAFIAKAKELVPAFELPKYAAPTNMDDVTDEFQYLDIYVKNTFKKDLHALRDEDFKVQQEPAAPGAAGAAAATGFAGNRQRAVPPPPQQGNPFFANPFMQGYGANMRPHPLQDPNFYPYVSKPKSIPYLRMFLGLGYLLMAAAELLVVISQALAKDVRVGTLTITGNATSGAGSSSVTQPVYYAVGTSVIIPIILILILTYMAYQNLKTPRYDRLKYRINTGSTVMFVLFYALLSIINDFWVNPGFNVLTHRDEWIAANQGYVSQINMLFGSSILFYSLCGAMLVLAGTIQIFNPPVDIEKVNNASQEWYDQSRNGGDPNYPPSDNGY